MSKWESGSIIILHLSKLWKARFFILCDVIFLVRLQEKFEIDHSCEWKGYISTDLERTTRGTTHIRPTQRFTHKGSRVDRESTLHHCFTQSIAVGLDLLKILFFHMYDIPSFEGEIMMCGCLFTFRSQVYWPVYWNLDRRSFAAGWFVVRVFRLIAASMFFRYQSLFPEDSFRVVEMEEGEEQKGFWEALGGDASERTKKGWWAW